MARKSDDDVVSTRLRMPAGLHRLLAATAKRNNRSINTEILLCLAKELGAEATKYVEHMASEQRRIMHDALLALLADPKGAAEILAKLDKDTKKGEPW